MYEIGTEVRYHGSVESQRGMIFRILAHYDDGRYTIGDELHILRGVHAESITPWHVEPVDDATVRLAISGAISGQHPMLITYEAADGEWTTRIIEPYEIATTRYGDVIVRAMDRLRGEPRTFRIDRIRAHTVAPGTFVLDHSVIERARTERDALARLRAEIREVASHGYGHDAARWTPGDPIL